jgi:hypothetical protein
MLVFSFSFNSDKDEEQEDRDRARASSSKWQRLFIAPAAACALLAFPVDLFMFPIASAKINGAKQGLHATANAWLIVLVAVAAAVLVFVAVYQWRQLNQVSRFRARTRQEGISEQQLDEEDMREAPERAERERLERERLDRARPPPPRRRQGLARDRDNFDDDGDNSSTSSKNNTPPPRYQKVVPRNQSPEEPQRNVRPPLRGRGKPMPQQRRPGPQQQPQKKLLPPPPPQQQQRKQRPPPPPQPPVQDFSRRDTVTYSEGQSIPSYPPVQQAPLFEEPIYNDDIPVTMPVPKGPAFHPIYDAEHVAMPILKPAPAYHPPDQSAAMPALPTVYKPGRRDSLFDIELDEPRTSMIGPPPQEGGTLLNPYERGRDTGDGAP